MPRRYRQSPAILRHGRAQQLSSTNIRNIYRYAEGYYIHKSFMGYKYRAYFACSKYGRSWDSAMIAAAKERDWLDENRRRILDRLQVEVVQKGMTRTGRARKRTKGVAMRRVVMEVVREMREAHA